MTQTESPRPSREKESVGKSRWQSEEAEAEAEEAPRGRDGRSFELESESFIGNGASIAEDDVAPAQRSPLEPESPGWPGFGDTTTAKEFNQKSQDVGFWEGEVVRELSVEEQIKRNRYYDEDEDEE